MKKRVNSIISILLVFVMLIGFTVPAFAAETAPTLVVDSMQAVKGQTATVKLSVENNPGMAAATFRIVYDSSILKLNSVDFNTEFGGDFDELGSLALPVAGSDDLKAIQISWSSLSNISSNGTFLSMNFTVKENAEKGSIADVFTSFNTGDFCNIDEEDVNFISKDGKITIIDGIPGDINGDKTVNSKDLIRLRKYFGGFDVEVDIIACDCNGDGNVNSKDLMRLRKYFSGWDVELFYGPSVPLCRHSLTKTEAIPAKCTENGNIAYWYCSNCKKYFADENATTEISLEDTVIPATGHTIVIDPSVPATYEHTGLTEGSHCSVCGTVLKTQNVIPKLEKTEYSITYNVSNNDKYLQSLDIENPNPTTYTSEDGLELQDLIVDGYEFKGWYTAQTGGTRVSEIPISSSGNKTLYAQWSAVEYKVQYKSDVFVDKSSDTYKVNEGLVLSTPKLSNYTFTGWTDEDGNLYENGTIPVGTTGSLILTANWTSERNKTFTKPKLDAPIIVEDEDSNTILFTYEIGEIQNVPVYTIHDFGYIAGDGITKTQTAEWTTKISDSMMNSFTKSLSNATTKSSNWALSKDWNEITSIDEQSYTEKGLTKEEAETIAKSNSNTWNVSSGSSGSNSSSTVSVNNDGWEHNVKVDTNQSTKDYSDNGLSVNAGLNANIGLSKTTKKKNETTSVGPSIGGSIGAGGETKWGVENSSNLSTSQYGEEKHDKTKTDTTSKSSSWNSSSSFGGSSTNSTSKTTSKIVSEKVAQTYGYGKSYSSGGASSESQGLQSTQSENNEYGSAVTYSTETVQTVSDTYTTMGTKPGYHRWVMVGKAHVFAIVGYDMTTDSFFTYTYSVMDDTEPLQQFEDYSYTTGSYNDAENGVIPFEVPYEVAEYVSERTCYSAGLKIDQSTGIITGYTGTDDYVVIPEYMNVGGGDVVKVTGISSTAFKGNTYIKEVRLSDFITEIPNNAFENCTSLFGISGGNITSIGNNAFYNCISMDPLLIDSPIKSIGTNAFVGCDNLLVNAANASVAQAVVHSGAKNIQLYLNGETIDGGTDALNNITLEVPKGTESFILFGYGNTYPGLSVVSDANNTIINKMNFAETESIPLKISSPNVTLNQVSVCSKGIGIVLSADNTNLLMQGNISVTTDTDKSVLSKNITFGESNEKVVGTLTVSGKVYVAGSANGTEYLAHKGDEIVYIDKAMFDNFLNSHKIVFDANGGTVTENNRTLVYGSTIGTLPVPKKEYCTFNGWYTEKDGGEEITEKTVFSSTEDVTYYAHWKDNDVTDWTPISDMPADAEIVNKKYKYTQRSYTTSGSSSMSGWTKYDTKSAWGSWGSWSSWQDSSVSSSDSRQVETQSVVASYNYKTVYHYYYYSTAKTNGNTSYTKSSSYPNRYTVTFDKALPKTSEGTKVPKQKYKWSNHHGTGKYMYVYADDPYTTKEVTSTNYKTQYRYRDRSLIYTYYFYKDDIKESTTIPTGDNISNVQEWVQYRVK